MDTQTHIDREYDAIVVGARAAGAATAMLMAREGMKVLAIDRQQYGSDTMSTHALMRGAVVQLNRWGVLDQVLAADTPVIRQTEFHYHTRCFSVPTKPEFGVEGLYAPRRTVLDRALVDAAMQSGADIAHKTSFLGLEYGLNSEIAGISLRQGNDEPKFIRTPLVIGADGRESRVAKSVDAATMQTSKHMSATIFGYFRDVEDRGYRWYYNKGVAAGIIPTNDSMSCIFVSCPPERFRAELKNGAFALFHQLLKENCPFLADEIADANPVGRLRGFPGRRGHMRQAAGPGWALVGDAGYFKDPATAHGITDALRDAEIVTKAALNGPQMQRTSFQTERNALSRDLFEVTDQIAALDWDENRIITLHAELNQVMKAENAALFDTPKQAA